MTCDFFRRHVLTNRPTRVFFAAHCANRTPRSFLLSTCRLFFLFCGAMAYMGDNAAVVQKHLCLVLPLLEPWPWQRKTSIAHLTRHESLSILVLKPRTWAKSSTIWSYSINVLKFSIILRRSSSSSILCTINRLLPLVNHHYLSSSPQ